MVDNQMVVKNVDKQHLMYHSNNWVQQCVGSLKPFDQARKFASSPASLSTPSRSLLRGGRDDQNIFFPTLSFVG
jgi:hypothetical protein